MPLDFKAAMSKLKGNPGKGLHFFFCEQGADGKPVLLVDTKAIPGPEQAEVLKTAKKKSKCAGEMELNKEGELELTPKGSAPSALAKGVQVVARNANAMPKAIILKAAVPEDKESQEGEGEGEGDETPPIAPPLTSPPPTGGFENYSSQSVPVSYTTTNESAPVGYETEIPPKVPKGPQVSKEIIARLKESTAKKFPDVLRSDPTMSKLLDKKAKTTAELAELMKKPGVTDDEVQPVVGKLDQIDQMLEVAQRKLNEQGVAPQQLREMYKDEEKKMGWRREPGAKPERQDGESDQEFAERMQDYENDLKLHESNLMTTKYFSEEEREKAKVNVDAKGRLRDSEGDVMYGGENFEYVMGTDGQLHQFKAKEVGEGLVKHPITGEMVSKEEYIHHSSVLSGKEVMGAGGIETSGGKIERVSNLSGHYKPGRAQMIQTVEALLKNGALLDKEWTDANGQPLSGKAQEVYKATMKLQKKIMEKLEDEPNTDVKSDLATIENAKKMLSKLGCGPSNRMSQAMVDFLDIRESMSGAEIHMAISNVKQEAKTVQEFLKTGGGSTEDGENKSAMLKELQEKTAKTRESLDQEAEERAQRVGGGTDGPSEDDLEDMTDELKARKRKLKGDVDDDDDDDDDEEEKLFSSGTMPEEFKYTSVPHPTKSGYTIPAQSLAGDLKIPVEELWKQMKAKRGGGGSKPMPKDFGEEQIKDPENSGYTIQMSALAKRKKMSLEELWQEQQGGGSTTGGGESVPPPPSEEKSTGKPMPKKFAKELIPDPEMSGYTIEAGKLAARRGITVEELWAEREGGGTTPPTPRTEEKPQGKPMPKKFAKQLIPDPEMSGYTIEAGKLAARRGITVEELWAEQEGK